MPKVSQISFNGGEYTEFMDPRVDVAKYSKGCRTFENLYPLPFGGAMARPGTVHGGEAKYSDKVARLLPFSFSTTTTFDIEMGENYFRFWKDQAQVDAPTPSAWVTDTSYEVDDYVTESSVTYRCIVDHTSGTFATDLAANRWEVLSILEVTSDYAEADLYAIQRAQVQDVVYLVHPDYPLSKLTRLADDDWSLSKVDWSEDINYPPLANRNTTSTTITPSGTSGTITLTASDDLFTADQATNGDLMMIGHYRDDTSVSLTISAPAIGNSIYVLGDWSFQTTGIGKVVVTLEESEDNTTWTTKRQYTVDGTANNVLTTGTEQSPKYLRANCTSYTGGSGGQKAIIEVSDPFVPGLVKITQFNSATSVTATVIENLHSTDATTEWAEQFFSDRRGHPRAVCFHRNRLCLGSSEIWLSQPGNYENFRTRNDADSGFKIALNRSGSPFVQWLQDLRELRVGTTQAEAVVIPENDNEVFSYSNYRVRWDSNYGSKHLQAESVNGTCLFLQPEGKTLRYQALTGIEDYYDANTLTTLADHIAGNGIIQTGYQRQPYPTYHGVREDGQLASLLYEESQDVQSWYRMVTDGGIESVSITPRPDEEDRVAYLVKRDVNGSTKRHIEFKALNQYRTLQDSEIESMWFVDDGIEITGSDMTTLTGLDHLEGVEVAILADGAKVSGHTVSGGQVTLSTPCDKAIVGRSYNYTLEPMYLESQGIMGQSKNISGAIVRLWRSGNLQAKTGTEEWSQMEFPAATLDTAPPLYTGDTDKVHLSGEWSRNVGITLQGSSPLPVNIMAITLEFEVGRG